MKQKFALVRTRARALMPGHHDAIAGLEDAMAAFADAYRGALREAAREFTPELSPFGLRILIHVATRGPRPSGAVAQHFDVDPALVSRQVRHLEDLGLVTNVIDEHDRRVRIIELTALGRERFDSLGGLLRMGTVVMTWPREDVERLTELIKRLARHSE